ncbi:MAG: hypothetical protein A2073_00860 [Deltaproteobacteria bacterium GWC2_42_11]|nr:MAG: hypothetical protein A2073_00860 [Deltaproteobacteria bacterium GWC2_42_11]HBO83530.1 nuclease [Deltaproteobacteria bacterium]
MKRQGILRLIAIISTLVAGLYYYSTVNDNKPLKYHVSSPQEYRDADVVRVIDGDTIVITGGERIRYIGIDAPEVNEVFYQEAKDKNRELVEGKNIRFVVCKYEQRDNYGRLLAWVYTGDIFVNELLVKEGYAKIFIIPPCGTEKQEEFKNYEKEAKDKGLGLWVMDGKLTEQNEKPIHAETAAQYIGKTKTVSGKVINVFDSGKAIFLNFGADYKKDFTAVIFNKDIGRFKGKGIDPVNFYKGKEVFVIGKIIEYNGPEIVVKNPSQIKIK